METTLTMENLLDILRAMQKIKPIDRSEYFEKYYNEISKSWIESNLKLTGQGTGQEKES